MQVDVRQKRGYDTSLRRPPPLGAYPHSVRFLHAHLEPMPDETKHPAVRYAHLHSRHELVMRYRVEVGREVCVIRKRLAFLDILRNPCHGILRAPIGTETERAVMEVLLKYRLDDYLDRALHHPVLDGGDAEGPHLAVRLLDVLPTQRACAVGVLAEFLLQPREESVHATLAPLYHLKGHAVHARCAAVRTNALPCATKRLLVRYPPEQSIEAELRLGRRLSRQSLRHQRDVGIFREVAFRADFPNLPFRQVPFTQRLHADSL